MASTGKTLPGTATAVAAGFGGPVWTNVNNIKAVGGGNATATFTMEENSDYVVASNFGFAIPAGNVIKGIIVYCLGDDDFIFDGDPLQNPLTIYLYNGVTIIGASRAPSLTGVETAGGSATDKWGLTAATLTPAIVNASSFGAAIQVQTGGYDSFGDARLDYVKMDVFYAPAGGGLLLLGMG